MDRDILPLENILIQLDAALRDHELVIADKLKRIQQQLEELSSVFLGQTLPRHSQEFDRILQDDLALKPKVDALREVDEKLKVDIEEMQAHTAALGEYAELTREQIDPLTARIQATIAELREQEQNLTKWMSESVLRDRGFSS